jgi:hypothetical protein
MRLFDRIARHHIAMATRGAVPVAARPAATTVIEFGVRVAVRALFFLDQRLPVGDRDLIIVRVDFAERQEAMAIAAVINEGRLQRRFYPCDLGEIDVAAKLFAISRFEVEFFNTIAAQDHHPGFLRVARVDEHFVGH